MIEIIGWSKSYKPEMRGVIISLMSEGASKDEVAAEIGIGRSLFYEWLKDPEKKEFQEAVEQGMGLSQLWWERKGRKNLENPQFNYTGWYMNMKNRFKWSDRTEQHNTGAMTVNWPLGKSSLDE